MFFEFASGFWLLAFGVRSPSPSSLQSVQSVIPPVQQIPADLLLAAPENLNLILTGRLTCYNEMKLSPENVQGLPFCKMIATERANSPEKFR